MTFLYGVWDGVPFDNRNKENGGTVPESLKQEVFKEFDNGNPIDAFVSHRGFFVNREGVSLLRVLTDYWKAAEDHACGKCTPCRNGTTVIRSILENAEDTGLSKSDLEEIKKYCIIMEGASACGLGQTVPAALLGALKYFPDDLVKPADKSKGDFFSAVTAPCIEACPAKVNIPRYIDYIQENRPDLSTGVLLQKYPFVGSCGRVCVRYCESSCRRRELEAPVDIKNLKRYAADALKHNVNEFFTDFKVNKTGKKAKVAIIGAGPAGITCAYHLLLKGGVDVDIFEAGDRSGGMTLTGIPPYRLPKDLVADESTKVIENLGGKFHFGKALGRDFTLDDLQNKDGYQAVFIGIGCKDGSPLGLPEDKNPPKGYMTGIEFLRRAEAAVKNGEKLEIDGDTVVVGCGNVAMDCCRTATRLGNGKVSIVYRRTEAAAPADPVELHGAHEEGVHFNWLCTQKRLIIEDGQVTGLECVRLEAEGDPNNRRAKLKEIPGSEFIIPCRRVIAAIGQQMDKSLFKPEDNIKLAWRDTCVYADESLMTSRPGVFAGGDCVLGPASFIEAMAQGEQAAESIERYIKDGQAPFNKRRQMSAIIAKSNLFKEHEGDHCRPQVHQDRVALPELAPEKRKNFDEVELGFNHDEAEAEANRCMRCYRVVSVATQNPISDKIVRNAKQ